MKWNGKWNTKIFKIKVDKKVDFLKNNTSISLLRYFFSNYIEITKKIISHSVPLENLQQSCQMPVKNFFQLIYCLAAPKLHSEWTSKVLEVI